ncbi:GerMN domain-containing protein [Cohnella thermotolerans]|uniref:GerMN domain-containing protein n=1 Tax=Cohnella thermotolerans TaxID=329858 RepID=UPI0003FFB790|nr:GerMN domain-containing protein [Cohnella thermotolerans]
MKLAGRKNVRKLLAAVLLLPLAAGCANSGAGVQSKEAIDPPPAEVEQTMLQAAETPAQAEKPDSRVTVAAGKDELTVYLLDRNGYVAPMTLGLSGDTTQSPENTAAAWLIQGKLPADQLPPGFSPLLPEGTKINSVHADASSGVATVDFASPFPQIPPKQERKAVEAIVWTMTELPGIRNVKITVDGQPLRQLPASGLPLAETLSRDIGINLEQAAGTNASRSMAVTLYFSARSEQGEGYFVPVTRLITRTPDRNRAALEELIKGPLDDRKLQPVLTSDVTVDKLSESDGTVSVSLKDPGWEPEMTVPAETMEAVVLTLTETAGEPKALITLNGSDEFTDSDNRSYTEPVDRPVAINALSR